jgi:hypothetical protein
MIVWHSTCLMIVIGSIMYVQSNLMNNYFVTIQNVFVSKGIKRNPLFS